MPRKRRSRYRFSAVQIPTCTPIIQGSLSGTTPAADQDAEEEFPAEYIEGDALGEGIASVCTTEVAAERENAEYASDCPSDKASNEFQDEPEEDDLLHENPPQEEEVMDLTSSEVANHTGREVFPRDCDGKKGVSLKFKSWKVLWGLLVSSGSTKLTRFQYQAMRMVCDAFRSMSTGPSVSWKADNMRENDFSNENIHITSLPHFATLSSTYKRVLYNHLTVKMTDDVVNVDTRKAGARASTYGEDGRPQTSIRFVRPSEYARMDMATPAVFSEMCKTSLSNQSNNERNCIDNIPVVAAREEFYGPARSFSLDFDNTVSSLPHRAVGEVGDIVEISLIGVSSVEGSVRQLFSSSASDTDL